MRPCRVCTRVRSEYVIGMSFGMHSRGSRGKAADRLRRDAVNQRGTRTCWRTQMLHKQQRKLAGHLGRNEKCTGDIDVKMRLYFRGNRRNGQSRKTENAALRHRVKSQWGARLQLHLCTVHLKSKTRMTTIITHALYFSGLGDTIMQDVDTVF